MGLYDYGIYQIIKRNARVNSDRIALISGIQKLVKANSWQTWIGWLTALHILV